MTNKIITLSICYIVKQIMKYIYTGEHTEQDALPPDRGRRREQQRHVHVGALHHPQKVRHDRRGAVRLPVRCHQRTFQLRGTRALRFCYCVVVCAS